MSILRRLWTWLMVEPEPEPYVSDLQATLLGRNAHQPGRVRQDRRRRGRERNPWI